MEMFSLDEPPPTEVLSGPTPTPLEPIKSWDESFAQLERVLEAHCKASEIDEYPRPSEQESDQENLYLRTSESHQDSIHPMESQERNVYSRPNEPQQLLFTKSHEIDQENVYSRIANTQQRSIYSRPPEQCNVDAYPDPSSDKQQAMYSKSSETHQKVELPSSNKMQELSIYMLPPKAEQDISPFSLEKKEVDIHSLSHHKHDVNMYHLPPEKQNIDIYPVPSKLQELNVYLKASDSESHDENDFSRPVTTQQNSIPSTGKIQNENMYSIISEAQESNIYPDPSTSCEGNKISRASEKENANICTVSSDGEEKTLYNMPSKIQEANMYHGISSTTDKLYSNEKKFSQNFENTVCEDVDDKSSNLTLASNSMSSLNPNLCVTNQLTSNTTKSGLTSWPTSSTDTTQTTTTTNAVNTNTFNTWSSDSNVNMPNVTTSSTNFSTCSKSSKNIIPSSSGNSAKSSSFTSWSSVSKENSLPPVPIDNISTSTFGSWPPISKESDVSPDTTDPVSTSTYKSWPVSTKENNAGTGSSESVSTSSYNSWPQGSKENNPTGTVDPVSTSVFNTWTQVANEKNSAPGSSDTAKDNTFSSWTPGSNKTTGTRDTVDPVSTSAYDTWHPRTKENVPADTSEHVSTSAYASWPPVTKDNIPPTTSDPVSSSAYNAWTPVAMKSAIPSTTNNSINANVYNPWPPITKENNNLSAANDSVSTSVYKTWPSVSKNNNAPHGVSDPVSTSAYNSWPSVSQETNMPSGTTDPVSTSTFSSWTSASKESEVRHDTSDIVSTSSFNTWPPVTKENIGQHKNNDSLNTNSFNNWQQSSGKESNVSSGTVDSVSTSSFAPWPSVTKENKVSSAAAEPVSTSTYGSWTPVSKDSEATTTTTTTDSVSTSTFSNWPAVTKENNVPTGTTDSISGSNFSPWPTVTKENASTVGADTVSTTAYNVWSSVSKEINITPVVADTVSTSSYGSWPQSSKETSPPTGKPCVTTPPYNTWSATKEIHMAPVSGDPTSTNTAYGSWSQIPKETSSSTSATSHLNTSSYSTWPHTSKERMSPSPPPPTTTSINTNVWTTSSKPEGMRMSTASKISFTTWPPPVKEENMQSPIVSTNLNAWPSVPKEIDVQSTENKTTFTGWPAALKEVTIKSVPNTGTFNAWTSSSKADTVQNIPSVSITVKKDTSVIKTEKNLEDEKLQSSCKIMKLDEKAIKKKKSFERCNIRDIKPEDELDAETLAAQKEEKARIKRIQESQLRAVQERLLEIEKEKEMLERVLSPHLFGGHQQTYFSQQQHHSQQPHLTQQLQQQLKQPFSQQTSVKVESNQLLTSSKKSDEVILLDSSDEEKSGSHKLEGHAKKKINDVIDISSSEDSNGESDDENSPSTKSENKDIPMLSDEEEGGGDPDNSGSHTNDCFNQADEEGRVLVNVGHPSEDPDIFLAPQIARAVKPHQVGGIRFLYDNVVENLERYKTSAGFGCILAHSMGLGKTVQVISFIDIFLRHTTAKCALCIVPINTIQNWKAEFNMWVPSKVNVDAQMEISSTDEILPRDYNVYIMNENHKTLSQRASVILEWKKTGGVFLLGYEMYRLLALRKVPKVSVKRRRRKKDDGSSEQSPVIENEEQVKKILDDIYEAIVNPGPDLVICDEGHRIKNSHASTSMALKSLRTKRRVVLTGYPLQNNLLEYWCMVDFVRPNYLGSRAEFCNMFERPIQNGQCADSTPRDRQLMRFRSHVLHSLLVGFVQRRGHSVLRSALPNKEEHVLLIRMTPVQRKLYKSFIKDLLYIQQATNPLKLFAVCCKIWNHPDILYKLLQEKKSQSAEDIDLDIDMLAPGSSIPNNISAKQKNIIIKNRKLSHPPSSDMTIHQQNGGFMPEPSYPAPKEKVDSINYEWAYPLLSDYQPGIIENSNKMAVLFVIIQQTVSAGDKLLIFSQSLSTLDLLELFLSTRELPLRPGIIGSENGPPRWTRNKNYFRLDGSTSAQDRERLINEFNQNQEVCLFLLSTRAGCLGINLIGANRIVVTDASWNPCHDAQAVCRIYRYGQKKPCHIYRLVSDNSLEKRIYDRQINKQGMSDRVIDELNPESNFTQRDVTTLILDNEEDSPIQDLSNKASTYLDPVLRYLCVEMSPYLSKEPFEHESLLLDRKDQKLTKREKRMAKQSYEMAKRANMLAATFKHSHTYYYPNATTATGTSGLGTYIPPATRGGPWFSGSSVHILPSHSTPAPMQGTHGQGTSSLPASPQLISALFRQGIMMQKLVVPSDVNIPVMTPNAPPVLIPAGQEVLLLRTPKGVYLRLPDGRIIPVHLPPSLAAKTMYRPQYQHRVTQPNGESSLLQNQAFNPAANRDQQSFGIVKQTLQCGGTVKFVPAKVTAPNAAQKTSTSGPPEIIDLSDDDDSSSSGHTNTTATNIILPTTTIPINSNVSNANNSTMPVLSETLQRPTSNTQQINVPQSVPPQTASSVPSPIAPGSPSAAPPPIVSVSSAVTPLTSLLPPAPPALAPSPSLSTPTTATTTTPSNSWPVLPPSITVRPIPAPASSQTLASTLSSSSPLPSQTSSIGSNEKPSITLTPLSQGVHNAPVPLTDLTELGKSNICSSATSQ